MPFGLDPLFVAVVGAIGCIVGAVVWTGLNAWLNTFSGWTLILFISNERTGTVERFESHRTSAQECEDGVLHVLRTNVGSRLQSAVAKAPDGQEFPIYPKSE